MNERPATPAAFLVRYVDPAVVAAALMGINFAVEVDGPLAAPEELGWFSWDRPSDYIGTLPMQNRASEGTTRVHDGIVQMHLLAQEHVFRVSATAAHEAIHCRQNKIARSAGELAEAKSVHGVEWEDEASLFFWDNAAALWTRVGQALGMPVPELVPGPAVLGALARRRDIPRNLAR